MCARVEYTSVSVPVHWPPLASCLLHGLLRRSPGGEHEARYVGGGPRRGWLSWSPALFVIDERYEDELEPEALSAALE
jgi:hypothetical protein